MYTPKYYRNENVEEVKDFIVHNGFGILVSCASNVTLRQAQDDIALRPFDSAQGDEAREVDSAPPSSLGLKVRRGGKGAGGMS